MLKRFQKYPVSKYVQIRIRLVLILIGDWNKDTIIVYDQKKKKLGWLISAELTTRVHKDICAFMIVRE